MCAPLAIDHSLPDIAGKFLLKISIGLPHDSTTPQCSHLQDDKDQFPGRFRNRLIAGLVDELS
tara:strand:+ start:2060 stop:2248 length:189 start_codon:yes stop_codon:yes gene_type:complete